MSVTDLGSAVPPPGGGGGGPPNDPLGPLVRALESNTNGLSKLTDRLNGLNPGGKGGPSTGGGSNAGEKALQKQLKMQGQRYRLEEQIHRLTYDALGRLAAFRRKESNDRISAEKSLARQRSAALNREAAAIESEQKAAQRRARSLGERRADFVQGIGNKVKEGGAVTSKDLLQAMKLGMPLIVNAIRSRLSAAKSKEEQGAKYRLDEQIDNQTASARARLQADRDKKSKKATAEAESLDELERKWLVREAKDRAKASQARAAQSQSLRDRQQAFYDKMAFRVTRGLNVTEGQLSKAADLNMPGLSRQLSARIAKQKSDAADKRVQDFEMTQHNKQVDAERKAKEKAEREANKPSGLQKLVAGMGRNLLVGKLYQAAHLALAPLEAFGTGIGAHWLKAWKALTDSAFNVAKAFSQASGMAGDAAIAENLLNTFTERFKRYASLQEMGTDVGGRAGAGMARASAGLAGGVAGAVGGAIDNPLTGFTSIVDKIGNAVGMADPGTMNRYNMILRDLTATIGQGLAPVVSMITKLMKEFGDYLQPVIRNLIPEVKRTMQNLFEAIKPLIPLFVVELQGTVQGIIAKLNELAANNGAGLSALIARSLEAANGMVTFMTALGAAANALAKFAANPIGFAANAAVSIGAGLGKAAAGGGANQPPLGGGMLALAAGLQKGNISGAAVAQNATIGSGSDLARKASQEAFISSSSRGNIEQQNVFQVAAQAAIQFFQNANKPAKVANGNAQPGIAAGQADVRKFGAGQPKWVQALMNFGG